MEMIEITSEEDIVNARLAARNKAAEFGFSLVNKTRIATAVSELARNIYKYSDGGQMEMDILKEGGRIGLRCVFIDRGPGIKDIEQAMSDGFTTSNGLGHGLPGSKRLMDEFEIASEAGKGTRVKVVKWK